MKDFAERLGEIREAAYGKHGRSAFARALGIPLTSYLNFENGRVPPMDIVVKMMALTRVNPRWLVHGEGPQYLPEGVELPPAEDAASLLTELLDENAGLKEQLLAVKRSTHPAVLVVPADIDPKEWRTAQGRIQAAADEHVAVPVLSGPNAVVPPENVFEADRDGWLLCPRSAIKHPKATFAFCAQDGAMAPAIPEGSLVGVDCSVRDPERLLKAGSGLVAARDTLGGCVVRQLVKAEKHWVFLTANQSGNHPPIVWAEGADVPCPVIGRVVFVFATTMH
jgi:hypothetical protein